MCGRFAFYSGESLESRFKVDNPPSLFTPNFNSSPGQDLPVIIEGENQKRQLTLMHWGLVPSWAKDTAIGYRLINARSETLPEKPSFRGPFKYHRCLIPADGFYEWPKNTKNKIPRYYFMKDKQPFSFAGLFDEWISPDGSPLRSFTIITTKPNSLVSPIHDRMPAILNPQHEQTWLEAKADDLPLLQTLLNPYSADHMSSHPVSTKINKASQNDPSLIMPLAP